MAGLRREHARAEVDRRPRHGRAGAGETALGWMPRFEDIDWTGLELTEESFSALTRIDVADWQSELAEHAEWFKKLEDRLPAALRLKLDLLSLRMSRVAAA